jgi:hypothetical protein
MKYKFTSKWEIKVLSAPKYRTFEVFQWRFCGRRAYVEKQKRRELECRPFITNRKTILSVFARPFISATSGVPLRHFPVELLAYRPRNIVAYKANMVATKTAGAG